MDQVIALLEARILHLAREEANNRRANYGDISRFRRLECEYLLAQVRRIATEAKP